MIQSQFQARFSLILILLLKTLLINAQDESSSDRIYTGGNFWVSFGDPTQVFIAPTVGYKLTETLSLGTTVSYQFRSVRSVSRNINLHDFGGSLFARNFFTETIFAQVEYEYLNFSTFNISSSNEIIYARNHLHSALAGGGITYSLSGRARALVTVLYNLTFTENGPYDSPLIVRGGVTLGL